LMPLLRFRLLQQQNLRWLIRVETLNPEMGLD
jgi:hypothetical protein